MDLRRETFPPRRDAYKVYVELFALQQEENETCEMYLTRQRTLLAELPVKHPESLEIDLTFGLLRREIRERVPRESIKTFVELTQKVRTVEKTLQERNLESIRKPRIGGYPIHNNSERFGHIKDNSTAFDGATTQQCSDNNLSLKHKLTCLESNRPESMRSKCLTYNSSSCLSQVSFCYCNYEQINDNPKDWNRPAIQIKIGGRYGVAFIDTGAKFSIASEEVYFLLQEQGHVFNQERALIRLADGSEKEQQVLKIVVGIQIGNRKFPTEFIIIPNSLNKDTLLGIDFLETASMVLDFPGKSWHFSDTPVVTYRFWDKGRNQSSQKESEANRKVVHNQKNYHEVNRLDKNQETWKHEDNNILNSNGLGKEYSSSHVDSTFKDVQQKNQESWTKDAKRVNSTISSVEAILTTMACPTPISPLDSAELSGYSPRHVDTLFREACEAVQRIGVAPPTMRTIFPKPWKRDIEAFHNSTQQRKMWSNVNQNIFLESVPTIKKAEHRMDIEDHSQNTVLPCQLSPEQTKVMNHVSSSTGDAVVVSGKKKAFPQTGIFLPVRVVSRGKGRPA